MMASEKEKTHFYVLVTGANSGVGFGTAHRLAVEFITTRPSSNILTLLLTTKTPSKGTRTISLLRSKLSRTHPTHTSRVEYVPLTLELSDLYSVAALARHLNASYLKLDAVVLNAAMGDFLGLDWIALFKAMFTDYIGSLTYPQYKYQQRGRTVVVGNVELGAVFAANVLGHYYLAHEVMGLLDRGDGGGGRGGRVVWQGSLEAYEWTFDVRDLQGIKATHNYESSKRVIDILGLTAHEAYARPWYAIEDSPTSTVDASVHTPRRSARLEKKTLEKEARKGKMADNVRCYVVHPGICSTYIFPLHPILQFFKMIGMYIARWVGSPWHAIDWYLGALSVVWLVLASEEEVASRDVQRKKWGTGCDRWGSVYLRDTEVESYEDERWREVAEKVWTGMEELRRAVKREIEE